MAVNYGLPYGPTGGPGTFVTGFGFFDDFVGSSLSATDDAAVWDITVDSGCTIVIAADEPFGAVTLNPNDAGLDASMELNGLPFQFLHENDAVFECRLKIATLTLDWFVGLATSDMDLASGSAGGIESSHVGFFGQGDANIDAQCGNGTSESRDDTGSDLTAATYVTVTWKWSAKSKQLRYYVDGVKKVTQSLADSDAIPSNATNLTLLIRAEMSGGGPGVDMDVDYIMFSQSRT
jgi:hypothetical protein